MKVLGFDHVQLAIPEGSETRARAYYADILGLMEIAKPAGLAAKGGVWFQCGYLQLHLGIEADFRPAKKAHPALLVDGYAELLAVLRAADYEVIEDDAMEGVYRCFTFDPFGNRIELIRMS